MDDTQRLKTRVLFVCMGNICRSPTAEATFRHQVDVAGTADHFYIDSAGTHAYHVGHPPDDRAVAVATERGVSMANISARKVIEEDFMRFDHIVAMDHDNLTRLEALRPQGAIATLSLLLEHDCAAQSDEVPDPYYGGKKGFELVFDWVLQATDSLASKLTGASAPN